MEILIPLIVVIILLWLFFKISSEPESPPVKIPKPINKSSTHETSYHDRLKKKRLQEQAEIDFIIAQQKRENELIKQRIEEERIEKDRIEKVKLHYQKALDDALLERVEEKKRYDQEQDAKAKKQNKNLEIEASTEYSNNVEEVFYANSRKFSFDTIKRICIDYVRELPKEKSTAIWQQLNSGVALLDTDEQLRVYIYAYANMHQAKLREALSTCINSVNYLPGGEKIEIIDWGCGQGIGTMIFIDYLKANTNFNCSISKVILIEPSIMAIKRAGLHVSCSLMGAEQSTKLILVNKAMDEVSEENIITDANTIKFHIFSNILDVEDFDIYDLKDKIVSSQKGINYFICVSPSINHIRNERLDDFQNYMTTAGYYHLILSERDTDICYFDKRYTRYEQVFLVDFSREYNRNTPPFAPADPDKDDLPF
jgi:hypothetical protein